MAHQQPRGTTYSLQVLLLARDYSYLGTYPDCAAPGTSTRTSSHHLHVVSDYSSHRGHYRDHSYLYPDCAAWTGTPTSRQQYSTTCTCIKALCSLTHHTAAQLRPERKTSINGHSKKVIEPFYSYYLTSCMQKTKQKTFPRTRNESVLRPGRRASKRFQTSVVSQSRQKQTRQKTKTTRIQKNTTVKDGGLASRIHPFFPPFFFFFSFFVFRVSGVFFWFFSFLLFFLQINR
ncbi:hypothetical protein V8C35DRAFT_146180 [Trichoderma chlorosporum]